MTIRSLAEVGARLEKAVKTLPGKPASPTEQYERYEMTAIQILDSEFDDFEPNALEEYLMQYLKHKRLELGLQPYEEE
ncbi:hypothetical protein [Amphritea sp. HPY]|uniref:hypothetical protein n=1 Tax=Amphritea sp. HPY TaxID=3421652 RepID=UPI003D7C5A21